MDVVFPWGPDELVVRLPERWRLLGSHAVVGGKDLVLYIAKYSGGKPLREG